MSTLVMVKLEVPLFFRQLAACAYRQFLFITKSATAYIVIVVIPVLLVGFMTIIQEFILLHSTDAKLAKATEREFGRIIDTTLATCKNTPYDYLEKPCVDLSYYIDDRFDSEQANLLNLVVADIVESNEMENVERFEQELDFKAFISDIKRKNESILTLSFEKSGLSKPIQAVLHYSMMRYGAKLNPQMNFRVIDKNVDYFLPLSEALFKSFHKVFNTMDVLTRLEVRAWPHIKYSGYKPITYFTGMITTLMATSLLLLLISILMDDLSHPCTSLYAFLSVKIHIRIISWILIGLIMCCAETFVMYAVCVMFDLPSYTEANFRDGISPYLVFSISLIPLALLITLCATPNIRHPGLATTEPIVTATYTVGLMSILTLVVLAPLSSTALKLADVHSSMSELESQGVPLSVRFVGYTLRLFNLAIGVALCSLGVSSEASLTSVKYSEISWLWIDMLWMSFFSLFVLLIKLRGELSQHSEPYDDKILISVENLGKSYLQGKVTALGGVNLAVSSTEKLFILGNAGAGKSTLLHCINGIEARFKGTIRTSGRIGFVSEYNTLWGCLTVEDHVILVLLIAGKPFSTLEQILVKVGLEEFPNRLARDLSFGMKRRLCLAMALAVDPDLLILDEVSSGVDPVSKQLIHAVIEEEKCCVATTHDLQEAELLATNLCFISKGEIVKTGATADLFEEYNIRYEAQLYGTDGVTGEELERIVGREVRDLGFGRYVSDVADVEDFERFWSRCKTSSCVMDCRLKAPSIDSLFVKLCHD